jgi:hypothetical protein
LSFIFLPANFKFGNFSIIFHFLFSPSFSSFFSLSSFLFLTQDVLQLVNRELEAEAAAPSPLPMQPLPPCPPPSSSSTGCYAHAMLFSSPCFLSLVSFPIAGHGALTPYMTTHHGRPQPSSVFFIGQPKRMHTTFSLLSPTSIISETNSNL